MTVVIKQEHKDGLTACIEQEKYCFDYIVTLIDKHGQTDRKRVTSLEYAKRKARNFIQKGGF